MFLIVYSLAGFVVAIFNSILGFSIFEDWQAWAVLLFVITLLLTVEFSIAEQNEYHD